MRTALPAGALAALVLFLSSHPAAAGPADYVITPIVEEGEREIDFKAGSSKFSDGTRNSAWSVGLGWGVTGQWFTELYAKWQTATAAPQTFDAWEWENKFQFTETGRYPLDIGLLIEVERPKDRSEGYELTWGPLLQADFTPDIQANLNLLITKHYRAASASAAELGWQWQLKYRWQPALEFGLQGFGGVGPWQQWTPVSEQSHTAGPAIFGRVKVGQRETIRYNAAWLFGIGEGSPRQTLRMQAEYEF